MIGISLPVFIIETLFIIIVSGICGFFFSKLLPRVKLGDGRVLDVLLYVVLGLPLLIVFLSLPSFFYVGSISIYVIVLAATAFCFYGYWRWAKKSKPKFSIRPSRNDIVVGLIILVLASVVFLSAEYMAWPPSGDIATGNGPRVTIFQMNNEVPLYPNPYLILYPPGFSTVGAAFNEVFNGYPALTVFSIGAAALLMVSIAIYLLSYCLTKNAFLSLLPTTLVFVPSYDFNLERWVFGHFFNGTYPNLIGFMLLFSYFICVYLFYARQDFSVGRFFLAHAVYAVALLFVYPAFLPFFVVAAVVLALFLSNFRSFIIHLPRSAVAFCRERKLLAGSLVAVALLVALTYLFVLRGNAAFDYIRRVLVGYFTGAYYLGGGGVFATSGSYVAPTAYFFSDFRIILAIVGLCISPFLFSRSRFAGALSVSSLIFVLFIIPPLSSFSWFFVPSRLFVLVEIVGLMLLVSGLLQLCRVFASRYGVRVASRLSKRPRLYSSFKRTNVIVYVACIVIFAVSLFPYVSVGESSGYGWTLNSHAPFFSDDFAVMQYATENIPSDALILGDGSFSCQFIMSMSFKNMTCFDFVRVSDPELFSHAQYVWDHPGNIQFLYNFVHQSNVSYVISMSERLQIITSPDTGNLAYVNKRFSPIEYMEFFDETPFLERVYSVGSSCIYKVNMSYELPPSEVIVNPAEYTSQEVWTPSAWGAGSIGAPILSSSDSSVVIPSGEFHDFKLAHSIPYTTLNQDDIIHFNIDSTSDFYFSLFFMSYDTVQYRTEVEVEVGFHEYAVSLAQLPSDGVGVNGVAFATGWKAPFPEPDATFSITNLAVGDYVIV